MQTPDEQQIKFIKPKKQLIKPFEYLTLENDCRNSSGWQSVAGIQRSIAIRSLLVGLSTVVGKGGGGEEKAGN